MFYIYVYKLYLIYYILLIYFYYYNFIYYYSSDGDPFESKLTTLELFKSYYLSYYD
jgi:hypothetical protein